MAEPYRNRGGPMPEREYGAPRARAGWFFMTYPELPDNDPIEVLEAAVPAKKSRGWVVVEESPGSDLNPVTDDGEAWGVELTEDGD